MNFVIIFSSPISDIASSSFLIDLSKSIKMAGYSVKVFFYSVGVSVINDSRTIGNDEYFILNDFKFLSEAGVEFYSCETAISYYGISIPNFVNKSSLAELSSILTNTDFVVTL